MESRRVFFVAQLFESVKLPDHLSNKKSKVPFCCFGDLLGMEILPSYVGIIINHEIRIHIKQLV